ncbi:MAG: hypothetical protein WBX30_05610, partial [Stellaceae bacterium]
RWLSTRVGAGGSNNDAVVSELRNMRDDNTQLRAEVVALRKQLQGGQNAASADAKTQHVLTQQTNQYLGPNISAPARRAVG